MYVKKMEINEEQRKKGGRKEQMTDGWKEERTRKQRWREKGSK